MGRLFISRDTAHFFWFFLSYLYVYGCTFCILLFTSVSYVFLLSCLCIIVTYAVLCYCYVCSVVYILFSFRLPWLRVFHAFPQLQDKCQGIPRKEGVRSAIFLISELCCSVYCLNCVGLCIVWIVLFYVLSVFKCVLYYCQWAST